MKRHHHAVWPVRRIDGKRSTAKTQEPLLQVYSAFWNIAYHALFHVDFYLSGAVLRGFVPPPPFREDEHRAGVVPNRAYRRAELQSYVDYNRQKARSTIDAFTDKDADRLVPRAGVPFAEFLLQNLLHAQEHAAQLHLFLGQHGIEPAGGAAAGMGRQVLRNGVRDRADAEIDVFVKSIGGYPRLLPLVFGGLCASIESREPFVVRFDLGASHTIRVSADGAEVESVTPKKVDATLRLTQQDFLRWMVADLDIASALADGRITIDGDAAALRRTFGLPSPR